MITGVHGIAVRVVAPVIGRITRIDRSATERADYIRVYDPNESAPADGYAAALCEAALKGSLTSPTVHSVSTAHLVDGDVVGIDSRGYVRTLYRRNSPHNFIFATDRCNSLCLMCSQPPKEVDETGIVERHLRLIRLIDSSTRELGITGGEPTLLGEGLLRIIAECRDRLPGTALHILSNGRAFADGSYAHALAGLKHPDLMIGIPVYSDIDTAHDYVVQRRGAFNETIRGLHRLGECGVRVEIRVVVHRATFRRLPQLAEFIYRNITFASQVALMGLEITGFTIPNLDALWIDPCDYQAELRDATLFLASRGMAVAIYNHQLCTLSSELWGFARRAISDWKNEYLPKCDRCQVKSACGGFFASAIQRQRMSRGISPIEHADTLLMT